MDIEKRVGRIVGSGCGGLLLLLLLEQQNFHLTQLLIFIYNLIVFLL